MGSHNVDRADAAVAVKPMPRPTSRIAGQVPGSASFSKHVRLSIAGVRATGVVPVIVVQFAAMAVLAALLGTWQDEEYTLASTAHGVVYAFGRAISFELQAPLYFCVLAALRSIDPSVYFARLCSVVAACAFTLVAACIAKRIWPQRSPRAFALLVAFNPFVVYAAVEIRLYALALLVSAMLWLAFDAGYLSGDRPGARKATVVLALAAVYLQYFLIFELCGFGVALVVARRGRALRAYLASMLPVAVCFIPLANSLRSQVRDAFGVAATRSGGHETALIHPLLDFTVPLGYESIAGRLAHPVTIALVVLVAAFFVAGRPRLDVRTASVGALALCVEALYLIVANVLHFELSTPRHYFALFVPEAAAVYSLVASFRAPMAARSATGLAIVLALATAVSLTATYRVLSKQGDWQRVGSMLSSATRSGDVIAVFPGDGVLPLARYYHGAARIVSFPRPLQRDRFDIATLLVLSQGEARRALGRLPQNGRLWLVDVGRCTRSDLYGCRELSAALEAGYRVAESHHFFGNDVTRLLPRKTP